MLFCIFFCQKYIFSSLERKSSLLEYYWRPSFIRDSHAGLIGDPHICIGDHQIFVGNPHIFIGDHQIFVGTPHIFIGEHQIFIGDPRFS